MKSTVIVAISDIETAPSAQARITELEARGFEGRVCIGPAALREALRALHATRDASAVLVLLDNDLRGNCESAQLVTTLYPECVVISLLDDLNEESLITALQSGADACCLRQASVALLSSILYSLLRRRRSVEPAFGVQEQPQEPWYLTQQAWVLEGPQGCSLPLTTAERAFLLYLTKQPEMRASYADLIHSVDPQSEELPVRVSQARLGVLVSRLRRKLQNRHGLELPVKALHKWGYMFTGETAS